MWIHGLQTNFPYAILMGDTDDFIRRKTHVKR